jgi:ATP/maltotriose-dependent transcriptional regulator MalT
MRQAVLMLDSDLAPDPGLLTAAAERSSYLGDLALARRLAAAAVQAGGGFRAQAVVANATLLIGPPTDAGAELAVLTGLAGNDRELVEASVNQATFLTWTLARPAEARTVLDEAEARVADADERLPLVALRSMIDGQGARPAEAERGALTVFAAVDPTADSVLMASCAMVTALATTGRADQMRAYVTRGVEAAQHATERSAFRIPLMALEMVGLRMAGYLDDASRIAAACWEEMKDIPLGAQVGCYLMGETELARGRVASALRWLREGRAGIEPFGDIGGWRYVTLIALTRALAVTGDVAAARQSLADLDRHRHPGSAFFDPEMVLAKAWVAAAEGSTSQAIALAHDAAALAAECGQLGHEVLGLHTAVCFGDKTVADRLAELASRVDGPRAPAAAAHAAALASGDGAALLAASVALEELGDLLAAADAAAQAADVHTQASAKHAAADRARRLGDGARSPALEAAASPLPLTDREREIVTLAARGLSNREIAERLVVSVRTIEGHLYRASAKLGVTNRGDYAGLIGLD